MQSNQMQLYQTDCLFNKSELNLLNLKMRHSYKQLQEQTINAIVEHVTCSVYPRGSLTNRAILFQWRSSRSQFSSVGPRISDEIFNERQSQLQTISVYNLELSFQEVNEYLRKHDRGWNFGNFIFDVIFMTEPWQDILLLIIYPHLKHFYSDNRWHDDI